MAEFFRQAISNITNPFTLAAFVAAGFFLLVGPLLRAIGPKVSARESGSLVRFVVNRGFWLAILLALAGFAFAGLQKEAERRIVEGNVKLEEYKNLPSSCDPMLVKLDAFRHTHSRKIIICAFQGENIEDKKIGKHIAATVQEDLVTYLRENSIGDVDIEIRRVDCFLGSHEDASTLLQKLGADICVWGDCQFSVVSDSVVFRSRVTLAHFAGSLEGQQRSWSDPVDEFGVRELDLPTLMVERPIDLVNFLVAIALAARADNKRALDFLGKLTPSFEQDVFVGYYRALVLIGLGKYDIARSELTAELQSTQPRDMACYLRYLLGGIELQTGRFESAVSSFLNSLECAKNGKDNVLVGSNYSSLARAYIAKGELALAERSLNQCLSFFRAVGDSASIANTYYHRGVLAYERGQYDSAIRSYEAGLAALSGAPQREDIHATILIGLGNAKLQTESPSDAKRYFVRALSIHQELGNRSEVAACNQNLGNAYKALKEPQEAIKYYQSASKQFAELGDPVSEASGYLQLGAIYSELGDRPKALDNFHKALAAYEQFGYPQGIAQANGQIGFVLIDSNQPEESLEFSLKSAAVLIAMNSPQLEIPMGAIAEAQASLGEPRFLQAVRRVEEAYRNGVFDARYKDYSRGFDRLFVEAQTSQNK